MNILVYDYFFSYAKKNEHLDCTVIYFDDFVSNFSIFIILSLPLLSKEHENTFWKLIRRIWQRKSEYFFKIWISAKRNSLKSLKTQYPLPTPAIFTPLTIETVKNVNIDPQSTNIWSIKLNETLWVSEGDSLAVTSI